MLTWIYSQIYQIKSNSTSFDGVNIIMDIDPEIWYATVCIIMQQIPDVFLWIHKNELKGPIWYNSDIWLKNATGMVQKSI